MPVATELTLLQGFSLVTTCNKITKAEERLFATTNVIMALQHLIWKWEREAPLLNYIGDANELLRKVEEETETFIAESLAKEILDEPDEPQPKRAMLSNLQDPRNLPRFPIKTWEKSVGTEQPECQNARCPVDNVNGTARKKALWTTTKNCTRKQSQNTMQVCLSCISLFGLGAHGKHVPVTHTRPVPLFIQPLPLSRRGLDSAVLPSYSCRNLYVQLESKGGDGGDQER